MQTYHYDYKQYDVSIYYLFGEELTIILQGILLSRVCVW